MVLLSSHHAQYFTPRKSLRQLNQQWPQFLPTEYWSLASLAVSAGPPAGTTFMSFDAVRSTAYGDVMPAAMPAAQVQRYAAPLAIVRKLATAVSLAN